MSYNHQVLVTHVRAAIEAEPRITLQAICDAQQVDRHTVNRALKSVLGIRFRQLKINLQMERLQRSLTDGRMRPIKQAAADAGYGSSAALAKRTRSTVGLSPSTLRQRGRS